MTSRYLTKNLPKGWKHDIYLARPEHSDTHFQIIIWSDLAKIKVKVDSEWNQQYGGDWDVTPESFLGYSNNKDLIPQGVWNVLSVMFKPFGAIELRG